jgi:16S rRNA (guanine527-N7)-methyltransferase
MKTQKDSILSFFGANMFNTLSDDQKKKLELYAELLIEDNKHLNLTRITEADEIRTRHFEDSLVVLPTLLDAQNQIEGRPGLIDIGSGAGFPGLVLAIALPLWQITSIEATGKKANFQQKIVAALGLTNVTIVPARAEELAQDQKYRKKFDVATVRAVGHLSINVELCVPFLRIGGLFLAWKGPKVEKEMPRATKIIKKLGLGEVEQKRYSLSGIAGDFRIIEARKLRQTPPKYPREYKVIKKESLN